MANNSKEVQGSQRTVLPVVVVVVVIMMMMTAITCREYDPIAAKIIAFYSKPI
jgi:hypothetical protein